jgi:hypothetical protein
MKITKSELKEMIREALREELCGSAKSLIEATVAKQYTIEMSAIHNRIEDKFYTDSDNQSQIEDIYKYTGSLQKIISKLNRLSKSYEIIMLYIYEVGSEDSVFNADMLDVEDGFDGLSGTFGTVCVFKNEIIDESEPFMKQFKIDPKGKYTGGAKATSAPRKAYIIASKYNPSNTDKAFYMFNDYNHDFNLVDFRSANIYSKLGDARFYANNILSMSDLHRIYILDANTLTEVDSLDYYEDYEDETRYPGYFDAL